MKKFIIPIILVLLLICCVVAFIIWKSSGPILSAIQTQFNISPAVTTVTTDTTGQNTDSTNLTETPSDSTSSSYDACILLTPAIAKQVLGEDVTSTGSGTSSCTYMTSLSSISSGSSTATSFGILTIVVAKSDPITAKAQFEQAKSITFGGKTETVTGINVDNAYYATNLLQLSILKGDSWIMISGTSDKNPSEKDLVIQTAKLIFNSGK